jgi:hypothetical protein
VISSILSRIDTVLVEVFGRLGALLRLALPVRLGLPVRRPVFGRAGLVQEASGAFPGRPKVDDLTHALVPTQMAKIVMVEQFRSGRMPSAARPMA